MSLQMKMGHSRTSAFYEAPTLESTDVYTKIKELDYRGTRQTVWRVNADLYFQQLAQVKSWT